MPSSRSVILDAALAVLREPDGPTLSLESAARASGLSKPGLMYHFPTKAALLDGVAQHVADRWEARMRDLAGGGPEALGPVARYRAYVDDALSDDLDRADLATFFDAHLRDSMRAVWTARMTPWLALPDDLDDAVRGRLVTARLAADGYWIAAVADLLHPAEPERRALRATLRALLEGSA